MARTARFAWRRRREDSSEVRLNVISGLDKVSEVIGVEQLSHSILPAVIELAEDKQWRVRQAVSEYMPLLARQLGQAFFDGQLKQLCLGWLVDCVYSIREAAVKNLPKLAEIFGDGWAVANIVPRLVDLYQDQTNYMYRLTAFHAINELAVAGFNFAIIQAELLPLVLRAASEDKVSNIKFNAAKTLGTLIPYVLAAGEGAAAGGADGGGGGGPGLAPIRQALEGLMAHSDNDVKYYAAEAHKLCPS
eukprot:SAG22_NODE_559_length_9115_cov_4.969720_5_plen_247_part_00